MAGKKSVYLETTIVSYLAAKMSPSLLVAAHQQVTVEWWEKRRSEYLLLVSELVFAEAALGDPAIAARRMALLRGLSSLPITPEVRELARALTNEGALPGKAEMDAFHIALAAYHEVDYLLTWNCRHIGNAEMVPVIRNICMVHGYACPQICTPEELMGEEIL